MGNRGRVNPPGWAALRKAALQRAGYVCQLQLPEVCTGKAKECDHIIPAAWGGTDTLENLQAVCSECHAVKSTQERVKARWQFRNARPKGKHPGLK